MANLVSWSGGTNGVAPQPAEKVDGMVRFSPVEPDGHFYSPIGATTEFGGDEGTGGGMPWPDVGLRWPIGRRAGG